MTAIYIDTDVTHFARKSLVHVSDEREPVASIGGDVSDAHR
jgi:hypothetical protein